jgi:hypothetical protein
MCPVRCVSHLSSQAFNDLADYHGNKTVLRGRFATKWQLSATRGNPPFSFPIRFALWQVCDKFIQHKGFQRFVEMMSMS